MCAQQDAKSARRWNDLVIFGEKPSWGKSINLWANNKGIIIKDEESGV